MFFVCQPRPGGEIPSESGFTVLVDFVLKVKVSFVFEQEMIAFCVKVFLNYNRITELNLKCLLIG